ncbi:MAG TPA: aminotransferase class V-fold PLP-dependent enzyme [Candidatus Bathyarchaeia archaeon]|nr:aminotransferase class V-fold PLP-dependent enzyme [Candidatus Bathyarchaeia archaeon]
MDVQKIRKDFPILETGVIYLDNTASSLTPEPVLEKMNEYYHQYRANVGRAVHRLSQRASEEYEGARRCNWGDHKTPTILPCGRC